MRKNQLSALIAAGLAVLGLGLAGCAGGSSSSSVYTRGQAQREQSVRLGVVDSVRDITIDAGQTGVGTIAGAAVGGIAGSNIGGGSGQIVGAILGAVAGGVAGQAIEKSVEQKKGVEVTVRFDNGEMRAIAQEDDQGFRPGDRVRVISSGTTTRILR